MRGTLDDHIKRVTDEWSERMATVVRAHANTRNVVSLHGYTLDAAGIWPLMTYILGARGTLDVSVNACVIDGWVERASLRVHEALEDKGHYWSLSEVTSRLTMYERRRKTQKNYRLFILKSTRETRHKKR